jgi:putative transcriptional regulator
MNIRHHLDEATLLSYAAGSMSQAMALVTACHLAKCAQCRSRAQQSEAIGGALLDNLTPASVSDDALASVLAAIDAQDDTVQIRSVRPASSQSHAEKSDVPTPLAGYVGGSFDDIDWKRIVPGVYYFDLPCQSGGVSRLLRIAPGKAMLPHSHDGNELTLVLRGSFTDEIGRFAVGDIADLDDQVEHQPLVDSAEDCICLVATDAPLKFTTLLGRLMQPMTGF